MEALQREVRHIDSALKTLDCPPVARKVLELTQEFYETLLPCNPDSFESLSEHAADVLDKIEESILDIHVVETA
jgi:hypothetical protein